MPVYIGMDGKPIGHEMGLNDTRPGCDPDMWEKFHADWETQLRLHPHGLPSERCAAQLRANLKDLT